MKVSKMELDISVPVVYVISPNMGSSLYDQETVDKAVKMLKDLEVFVLNGSTLELSGLMEEHPLGGGFILSQKLSLLCTLATCCVILPGSDASASGLAEIFAAQACGIRILDLGFPLPLGFTAEDDGVLTLSDFVGEQLD